MIKERSGGGDGQARVVDAMFTSRNAREATCAVFDKLREGAPFRIAPTALFDAQGILVKCIETSFSRARREKFAGTSCRIVRKRREATNLLSLLASWEARAKRDDLLEDRVCIEATQDRPVCLDSASFRQWIRRRAWQEAEVRADTYDPLQQGYIAGPFFAQAFVLSDDGNQYDVEFRRKARSNEPHVSYRVCRRIAAMSIAKAREGKSKAGSFSDSEKRKTKADILELADDDDLFPAIDSSTKTALRNDVNAIVEYLEETYEISVHALSVSFIRGAMHRELILLHVTSVAWDSPPREESLESKQSSVHRRVSHRAEQESKSPETITSSLRGNQTKQKVEAQPQVQRSRPTSAAPALSTVKGRYAETKVAVVSRELSRLRDKVARLEARADDDAAKLLRSDKALATAQAALQLAHKESQARESELRASLARQQSELNSIVAELARARSQLELERKLRSKAEVDAQNAKHALTSLEVHREFVRKSEG